MPNNFAISKKQCTFATAFHKNSIYGDPLAQLVEHNTFNVGVLGSSPKRITKNERKHLSFFVFTKTMLLRKSLYLYILNFQFYNNNTQKGRSQTTDLQLSDFFFCRDYWSYERRVE